MLAARSAARQLLSGSSWRVDSAALSSNGPLRTGVETLRGRADTATAELPPLPLPRTPAGDSGGIVLDMAIS